MAKKCQNKGLNWDCQTPETSYCILIKERDFRI